MSEPFRKGHERSKISKGSSSSYISKKSLFDFVWKVQSINLIREESSDLAKRGILAAGQLYGISNQRLIRAERIIQEGTTIPISLVLHRIFKSLLTAWGLSTSYKKWILFVSTETKNPLLLLMDLLIRCKFDVYLIAVSIPIDFQWLALLQADVILVWV